MSTSRVYGAVRDAIKRGVLVRPDECQRCGLVPPPCSDGRAAIQAHHHDYSKPLDVEWICSKCHRKETPLPSVIGGTACGERNGQAKLTDSAVVTARLLRKQGMTYNKIAAHLNVSKRTAMRVVKRQQWKHVQDAHGITAAPAGSEGE